MPEMTATAASIINLGVADATGPTGNGTLHSLKDT